jgi:hypothetical protein
LNRDEIIIDENTYQIKQKLKNEEVFFTEEEKKEIINYSKNI